LNQIGTRGARAFVVELLLIIANPSCCLNACS